MGRRARFDRQRCYCIFADLDLHPAWAEIEDHRRVRRQGQKKQTETADNYSDTHEPPLSREPNGNTGLYSGLVGTRDTVSGAAWRAHPLAGTRRVRSCREARYVSVRWVLNRMCHMRAH